jgi:hypothetical protein
MVVEEFKKSCLQVGVDLSRSSIISGEICTYLDSSNFAPRFCLHSSALFSNLLSLVALPHAVGPGQQRIECKTLRCQGFVIVLGSNLQPRKAGSTQRREDPMTDYFGSMLKKKWSEGRIAELLDEFMETWSTGLKNHIPMRLAFRGP